MDASDDACPGILVVEDKPDIREVLVIVLTEEGYRVVTAIDGHDAREVARRESPDLILVDANMPRLDGAKFCRVYREAGGLAPIILMSAGDPETITKAASACGAVAFIAKPFDVDRVLETVARYAPGCEQS